MRVFYFCNVNQNSPAAVGVFKKIKSQINTMKICGHEVILGCYKDEQIYQFIDTNNQILGQFEVTHLRGNQRTNRIIEKIKDHIATTQYDVLYSRFETYSLGLANFYIYLKKQGIKVLLEVPTYPLTQRWTSISSSLKAHRYKTALQQFYNTTVNSLGTRKFCKGVDRIVTNNGFDTIWNTPTIHISNGVDTLSTPKHIMRKKSQNEVRIIGVANIAKWHGFDRVIEGLKNYYSSEKKVKVFFDVVGSGLEQAFLKRLVDGYNLQEIVVFHGTVVGDNLDSLFTGADVGVSVLGAHRSHMKTCDSLKSKEYCARGLPFIAGKIENIYSDVMFAKLIEDNDEPLSIQELVEFVQNFEKDDICQEQELEFAVNKCDWKNTFINVLKYIGDV